MAKIAEQKGPIKVEGSYKTMTYPEKEKQAREELALQRKNLDLTITTPKRRK